MIRFCKNGQLVETLACPHCHSFIDLCFADDAALAMRGQGGGIGTFGQQQATSLPTLSYS